LAAVDGPGYEAIFSQVQNALGGVVADRIKLMAESSVAGIESSVGRTPFLILVTPVYLSENFTSSLPREAQFIFMFRPTPPYEHLATLRGTEYRWANRDGKIMIWSDATNGHEYTRTKYIYDGNAVTEAGSQTSPFQGELSVE
jgi:hypothetical protein